MLLRHTAAVTAAAGLGAAWRGLACTTRAAFSTDSTARPLSGDPGVRDARRQQPSSLTDPPHEVLHDSLSEAAYDYRHSRSSSGRLRISSLTDPQDYYLANSLSEGSYGMPRVLQSGTTCATGRRSQGSPNRPVTLQRIVVVNRSAAQASERLHDSYSEIDYNSPYKGGR